MGKIGWILIAGLLWFNSYSVLAATDLRVCADFSTVVRAVQDEGFHPWFSYRAGEADCSGEPKGFGP